MDISKIRKKAVKQEERKEEDPLSPKDEPVEEIVVEEPAPIPGETDRAETNDASEKGEEQTDQDVGSEIPGELDGVLELLTFSLSGDEFAFRVSEVEEIIKYQHTTRVPTLPDYVIGITSLRGKIIPVINLKRRINIKSDQQSIDRRNDTGEMSESALRQKILVLSGPRGLIGANVDNVLGVLRFPGGKVLDPPAHLSEEEMAFIEGVVELEKRFISILRSEEILDMGAC